MIVNLILLFLAAFIPGLVVTKMKNVDNGNMRLILVFGGAYLFSITIVHIFPELYAAANGQGYKIGIYVLAGFFMQQILEYFTSGVEHGHIHKHEHDDKHGQFTSVVVLIGLCLHAFLEGSMLAHPSTIHAHSDSTALLGGILIHKIPASIALMSVLLCDIPNKKKAILFLFLFSIASPVGLLASDMASKVGTLSQEMIVIIFGVVSGNFLYISTTIFYETSPDHHFNARKTIVSLLGVFVAILAELFL
jgi:zinc transporter ZupT